ncbi:hypothetical protein [Leptotrichia wadei]|nr:hypothetical protein [Leptotrichia wadei]
MNKLDKTKIEKYKKRIRYDLEIYDFIEIFKRIKDEKMNGENRKKS